VALFNSQFINLLALGMLALPAGSATSAEIKSLAAKDGRVVILITGEITPGDADNFSGAIKQANDAGKFVANVRLNSDGGNLLEGVKLADAVRFGKISTNVGKNATCASACFLVFAAGSTKYVSYGAQIGVHGASDESGNETVQSGAATVSMARIAKDLGVPAAIIGRMVVTPPGDMVWLSPQDLQSMGTAMVGKPAQLPTTSENRPIPEQTAPGNPVQLQPSAKASAPMSWGSMVENAFSLSAKQNGGNPRTLRSCQPEEQTCATGIMFKMDERDSVLLSRQDINGKIIQREICTFNSFGDIRSCMDWDTKATHRDMKDSKGAWSKVSD
jgi:hypothetical protein